MLRFWAVCVLEYGPFPIFPRIATIKTTTYTDTNNHMDTFNLLRFFFVSVLAVVVNELYWRFQYIINAMAMIAKYGRFNGFYHSHCHSWTTKKKHSFFSNTIYIHMYKRTKPTDKWDSDRNSKFFFFILSEKQLFDEYLTAINQRWMK